MLTQTPHTTSPSWAFRAVKNRFGAVNELSIFAKSETGLQEVSNSLDPPGHKDLSHTRSSVGKDRQPFVKCLKAHNVHAHSIFPMREAQTQTVRTPNISLTMSSGCLVFWLLAQRAPQ